MGGFGAGYGMGRSVVPRVISSLKRRCVVLPEMSFAYLASIFRNKGAEVTVTTDLSADADIVFIHSSLVGSEQEREAGAWVKRQGRSRVGYIGPLATAMPERFLESGHFVIRGEPEKACMDALDGWSPAGVVESSPLEDLGRLPFPAWRVFDVRRFSYRPSLTVQPVLPVLSSRGCSFSCTYCPYRWYQGRWRGRTTENVLEELEYIVRKFHVRGVIFRDPLFTFDRARCLELAQGMIDLELNLKWACETRLETLDEELLQVMQQAGLSAINVGIESASSEVLRSASRSYMSFERQRELVRCCDSLRVRVAAFYVLGLPGDTRDSILDTIAQAKRLNTHVAEFYVATPFPGSPLYEQVKGKLLTDDLTCYDGFTPVFEHDHLSPEEIARLREKAFTSYYLRPQYFLRYIRRRTWG